MNNRQNGRRRGRGGQRPQGIGGGGGGNDRGQRSRGNAAQLLEKYKNMARDAQLAGDRVQTEYYLQFADHYFRVLGETRSRFEDQRPGRDDDEDDDQDDLMDGDGDEEMGEQQQQQQQQRPERQDRQDRQPRGDRFERRPREDRQRDDRPREERSRDDRPREDRPRRERFERRPRDEEQQGAGAEPEQDQPVGIADFLPPAIGAVAGDSAFEEAEEAPKPKRRTRRPRVEDNDGEIAPAA